MRDAPSFDGDFFKPNVTDKLMRISLATSIGIALLTLPPGCDNNVSTPDPVERPLEGDRAASVTPELWPESVSPVVHGEEIEARVDRLLAGMSSPQKVGQIIQADIASVTPDDVRQYYLGSILNGGNSAPGGKQYAHAGEWLALADAFYEASMQSAEEPIPVLWGSDAVHGHANVIGATVFPHNIGLGAMGNPDLMREIGRVTATEMRVTGIGWTFAPTIAVARDDRWGRSYESYSENPALVSEYTQAMLEGLQGVANEPGFLQGRHVIATAKHFLADGGTENGIDQGDARISEAELVRIHTTPYTAAIEAGVQTVMASFSSWRGSKIHGNYGLLTTALKERMGFNGFVVGDWNGHGQVPGCSVESCAQAINAGLDMFMAPDSWRGLYDNTLRQVEAGEIPMQRLDDAVRRILRVKLLAGVFDAGPPSSWSVADDDTVLGAPEHRAVARQAVRESLVLLKNAGGILPLSADANILVAGDGARNLTKQMGGWTLTWQGSNVDPRDYVNTETIYDGIGALVGAAGGQVEFAEDGNYDTKPDVAIVVFGEDPYAEFQGDRAHLRFMEDGGKHLALMQVLRDQEIPVVTVFLSGRPMWVNPEINASDAFVAAWLPGSEGGGVADVLFGNHEFTGKLPFSWPRLATDTVNVGDPNYDPLFAFGYGLTTAEPGTLAMLPETSGLSDADLQESGEIFADGAFAHSWSLLVSDRGGEWIDATSAAAGSAAVRATMVDSHAQEDSRQLVWPGGAGASARIARDDAIDWTRESNGELALTVQLRVDRIPTTDVMLSMHCGAGCSATINVAEALRLDDTGSFGALAVPLNCFAGRGADMSQVEAVELSTDGEFAVTIAGIALSSAAEGRVSCP